MTEYQSMKNEMDNLHILYQKSRVDLEDTKSKLAQTIQRLTEAEKTLQSFMKGGISTENRAGRSLTCLLHREIQGLHCLNLI